MQHGHIQLSKSVTQSLLPANAPPITEVGSSDGKGKLKCFFAMEEDTELRKGLETGQSLAGEKSRRMGRSFQVSCKGDTGRGLWVTGERWEAAGCRSHLWVPQTRQCVVEGRDWSSQTLPSAFPPHGFAQLVPGPLRPQLESPGCYSISWVLLSPKGSPLHLLPAVDGLLGMSKPSHQPAKA